MTMAVVFVSAFLVGPWLYAVFLRLNKEGMGIWKLTGVFSVTLMGGFVLFSSTGDSGGSLIALSMMWLAWIFSIVLIVQMVRDRAQPFLTHRQVTIVGSLATPLPWFGLATAQMMAT